MLNNLEKELRNWLRKLENFLKELNSAERCKQKTVAQKKVLANFFDKKAEKIINEYWEILQLVYDEDVLPEILYQGFDVEQLEDIPKPVWDTISPKLKPILQLITNDASDLLKTYETCLGRLNKDTKEDLQLISTTTTDDILIMFNTILKEKI